MIRFVDLTDFYWVLTRAEDKEMSAKDGGPSCVSPVCAFVDTMTDTFVATPEGVHVFFGADDVQSIDGELAARCTRLVPPGFWDART